MENTKTKCPCCKNGCNFCTDGYFEAYFADSRELWSFVCRDCNIYAGSGYFGNGKEPYVFRYVVCPNCGNDNLKLQKEDQNGDKLQCRQ